MPTPRISKEYNNELMFLTLTTIEWINIFTDKEYFNLIMNSLKYCQKEKGLYIYGYVIMTNHIHLIISSKDKNLADIIRDFKSFTTNRIKKLLTNDRRKYILRLIINSFTKKHSGAFQI